MIETVSSVGNITILRISGSLDASVSMQVGEALSRHVAEGRSRLVLDLQQLEFIDSSGLSALLAALRATRREGGDLVLLRLPSVVRPAIELTRLDRVFSIVDDEPAALAVAAGRVGATAASG